MVRTRGDEVSVVGRNTQGVRIIRLKDNENLVSLARIAEPEEEEEGSFLNDAEGSSLSDAEGSSSNDAKGSSEDSQENSQDDSSEE